MIINLFFLKFYYFINFLIIIKYYFMINFFIILLTLFDINLLYLFTDFYFTFSFYYTNSSTIFLKLFKHFYNLLFWLNHFNYIVVFHCIALYLYFKINFS